MQTKSPLVKIAGIVAWHWPLSRYFVVGQDSTPRNIHPRRSRPTRRSPPTLPATTGLSLHGGKIGRMNTASCRSRSRSIKDRRRRKFAILAHGAGYQLFLTSQEAVLTLHQPLSGRHEKN